MIFFVIWRYSTGTVTCSLPTYTKVDKERFSRHDRQRSFNSMVCVNYELVRAVIGGGNAPVCP